MDFRNRVYKTLYNELTRAKDSGLPVAGVKHSVAMLCLGSPVAGNSCL